MDIYKTYLLADAVVSLFIFEVEALSGTEKMHTLIYPHINGREQGFNIHIYGGNLPHSGISCFVYEHRNTDEICVTVSTVTEWKHIKEKEYENTNGFGHNIQKAVDYIIKHITGELSLR